ncbi:MAG: hypothetical protein SFV15_18820 [Polyangiaceae bacterium]|nr:hypothetical protein [Polyangiaceae bacterium]
MKSLSIILLVTSLPLGGCSAAQDGYVEDAPGTVSSPLVALDDAKVVTATNKANRAPVKVSPTGAKFAATIVEPGADLATSDDVGVEVEASPGSRELTVVKGGSK